MRLYRPVIGWFCVGLFAPTAEIDAQVAAPGVWAEVDTERRAAGHGPQLGSSPHPAAATLLSFGLPGAGQHILGQRRKWAYLGLEAVGLVLYLDRRGAGRDYRDRYRDFAWSRARLQDGSRLDGDFDYYETMSNWTRSGSFDADPAAAGVQPELDPTTFNGSIWALATQIFLPGGGPVPESDPTFQSALEYYMSRAYASGFLWDWSQTGAAQQEFGGLIEASDDRFRQATNVLGALIANHVVSSVDAFLSARGLAEGVELGLAPSLAPSGSRWSGWLRLRAPW